MFWQVVCGITVNKNNFMSTLVITPAIKQFAMILCVLAIIGIMLYMFNKLPMPVMYKQICIGIILIIALLWLMSKYL